jgi:hypothetical protein
MNQNMSLSTIVLTIILSITFDGLSQQAPTGAPPANNTTSQASTGWYRGGNALINNANNIFGTLWNSPIYVQTSGLNRVTFFSTQGGMAPTWVDPLPFGGGMAINLDPANPIRNPLSLLHIGEHLQGNLTTGGGPQGGYRSWMKVGTFYGHRSDQLYVGMKPETSITGDRADAIINWGDNTNLSGNPITDGPDFLRVIFTAPRGVAGYNTYAAGNDGLEVMRFQHNGSVGIGNFYNDALFPYRNPSRRLEILSDKTTAAGNGTPILRMTHTQQNPASLANTGKFIDFEPRATGDLVIQAFDNTLTPTANRNFRQRYVGINTSNPGNTLEVNSQFSTPNTPNGTGGTGWAGLRFTDLNSTSVEQTNPGTGVLSVNAAGDVIYVPGSGPQGPVGPVGPAGPQGPAGGAIFFGDNGASRNPGSIIRLGDAYNTSLPPLNTFTPLTSDRQIRLGGNDLIFSGNGNVAIGLSHPDLPTERLDVNGNARFRNVPNLNAEYIMLGKINSGPNDIELSKLPFSGNTNQYLSGNGTWQTASGFGGACGTPATTGALNTNSRVNLNNNNFYFANLAITSTIGQNKVAVGANCSNPLPGKFNSYQKENTAVDLETIAIFGENRDVDLNDGGSFIGVNGWAIGVQTYRRIYNIGGSFLGYNSNFNVGVRGIAMDGIYSNASTITTSTGGEFLATSTSLSPIQRYNYGVKTHADGGSLAYGIYASSTNSLIPRAGYFNGLIEVNGQVIGSDQQFKDSIITISGGLKVLSQLKPVQYNYKTNGYEQFHFGSEKQYGFIAQQVQTILPDLVHNSKMPAQFDSTGTEISPEVSYKSLNYIAIIPINTQAIIELNQKVERATLSDESIKTNVQDLTGSLDKVLDMRGVSYDWDHSVHPELNLDSTNHIGFIAQEISQIDSRLTYLADDSLLHIEYDKVVPILAEAIQELNDSIVVRDSIINSQQSQINDLNNRLSQLENCLSGILPYLCQLSNSAIQANTPQSQEAIRSELSVRLSNRETIILDQNVPNPFAEQTVINFSIPESVQRAQIHFYDGQGKLIQSVDVKERGLGSLTVFGSDLSMGVYTYTLVADGQVAATKKMMKQ